MEWLVPLLVIFLLGAAVGSFLNVCIYRLPMEKSIVWPMESRCGSCLQPIRWWDNIPLISYWLLRGRCRACGQRFSIRYFLIELGTALAFVGLFYLEVILNIHDVHAVNPGNPRAEAIVEATWVFFCYHAVLFCFLLVAAFSDLDNQNIPLSLTVTGTVIGLLGSIFWPWPWPHEPTEVAPVMLGRSFLLRPLPAALYPWPVWWPLPPWLAPGGNWQTGLATGVAGLLVGTIMLRLVRFTFGLGMGAEYMDPADAEAVPATGGDRSWFGWLSRVGGRVLGLGDADLMMMAGSFLGWQPVAVAFFLAVFPGLLFGLTHIFVRGTNVMPFGPALAIGVMATGLGWHWIAPRIQLVFFDGTVMLALAGVSFVFMVVAGYVIRLVRMMFR
jgi:leader peptidase (prepilin peptidase)/N-methyltransferase